MNDFQPSLVEAINDFLDNKEDIHLHDIFNHEDVVVGKFVLCYSSKARIFIVSIQEGELRIVDTNSMRTIVRVKKDDKYYSFPTNTTNVPRSLLITLYKAMRDFVANN